MSEETEVQFVVCNSGDLYVAGWVWFFWGWGVGGCWFDFSVWLVFVLFGFFLFFSLSLNHQKGPWYKDLKSNCAQMYLLREGTLP